MMASEDVGGLGAQLGVKEALIVGMNVGLINIRT